MKKILLLLLLICSFLISAQALKPTKTDTISANAPAGIIDILSPVTIGTSTAVTKILDEDNMASNSATALATQQSIKAYVDSSISTLGGLGDVTITSPANNEILTWNGSAWVNRSSAVLSALRLGTGITFVTDILDEDNMISDSATALATQQSIKAYVDTSVANATVDGLSDATITSAANNDVLTWNGSAWVNKNTAILSNLGLGATPNASSVLDVTSTVKGSRPCPTMTETQRNAIGSPAIGLCVYNSTTSALNMYNGSAWAEVGSSGGGISSWVTTKGYIIGDVVHESNSIYLSLTNHTSGTFATDLANNDWIMLTDKISIGVLDSAIPSANGLVYNQVGSGSTIVAQSASATNPGLVNTTTQTLAGEKTFNTKTNLKESVSDVTNTRTGKTWEKGLHFHDAVSDSDYIFDNNLTVEDVNGNKAYYGPTKSQNFNAGITCPDPLVTDNLDGTVNVGSHTAYLYNGGTLSSNYLSKYTMSAVTNLTLTNDTINYVIDNYNAGSPIITVTTNLATIDFVTVIPVATIFREGTELHILPWNCAADALSNKLLSRTIKTDRFKRETGLALTESGTRAINISSGNVWYGESYITLSTYISTTDDTYFYYHNAGVWTHTPITAYNNTQYDDGTTLQTLVSNRFAVNWVYRGVESNKHAYVVLGDASYSNLAAAEAAQPRNDLPSLFSTHTILVGKIIVLKSAASASAIQSAFNVSFVGQGSSNLTIGALDSATANSNGLTFDGTTNILSQQSASATNPGLVNTTTQTMAGAKTFSGSVTASTLSASSTTAAGSPLPKLSKATINGLGNVAGNMAYDTDKKRPYFNDGAKWMQIDADRVDFLKDKILSDFSYYNDGAVAIPVDGTGDAGGTARLAVTEETVTPISNVGLNLKISKTGTTSAIGQGISVPFSTRGLKDRATIRTVNFEVMMSANYADGDMAIYLYDVSNSRLINPSDQRIFASSFVSKQKFSFQLSPDSDSYRLIVHQASTSALDYTLTFQVSVTEQSISSGSKDIDFKDITTVANATLAPLGLGAGGGSYSYYKIKERGDTCEFEFYWQGNATAPTGASSVTFPLPFTASYAAINNVGTLASYGITHTTPASSGYETTTLYLSGTQLYILKLGTVAAIVGTDVNASASLFAKGSYKVAGWSSNAVKSEDSSGRFIGFNAQLNNGQIIPANTQTRVTGWNENSDTTASFGSDVFIAPETGFYDFNAMITFVNGATPGTLIYPGIYKNVATAAVNLAQISLSGIANARQSSSINALAVPLVKGDIVEFSMYSSGFPLTLIDSGNTWFSGKKSFGSQQISQSEPMNAKVLLSGNQTGVNTAGSFVKINFNTVTGGWDSHNAFNTSLYRYEIKSNGKFEIEAHLGLLATNVLASTYLAVIYKNGVAVTYGDVTFPTAGSFHGLSVKSETECAIGDYIEVYLYGTADNSTNTLTVSSSPLQTFLKVKRI